MSEIKPFTGIDDRVILADVIPLDTPFTLNIFPSNICNFRCNYCAQSLGKEKLLKEYGLKQDIMSVETMEKIVEQAKQFGRKFKLISMMGHGEPLCNSNLPEFINMIKKADIAQRVDIITNGSLLTPEYSKKLIDSGLDVLRVSLQGISSSKYKEICGANINFDEFLSNLSYFYKNKKQCNVYVKTMDVSLEENQEQQFYDMFSNISDRMYIDSVKPVYEGVKYTEEQRNMKLGRYGNMHEERIVCAQPFYMLSVWTNGDVTPCDALYKADLLGNIHEDTLNNMWNSRRLKKFCYMHLNNEKNKHFACKKCCAPNDVQHKEDVLDDRNEELKMYFRESQL